MGEARQGEGRPWHIKRLLRALPRYCITAQAHLEGMLAQAGLEREAPTHPLKLQFLPREAVPSQSVL